MKTKLSKKVVVISGGSGYLGSFISHLLREQGFTVLVLDRKTVDVTDTKEIRLAAKKIKAKYGSVETVIHAASARLIRQPILTQSRKDFEAQFSVNVLGAFNLFKYFCPIISRGGAIIGITSKSIDTEKYSPSGSYVPAKYALRGLLNILKRELSEQSIRVYEIAPAFMPGGLNSDIPKKVVELIKNKSKPEEITTPEKISNIVLGMIKSK